MTRCSEYDFPCQNVDYSVFDKTAQNELKNPSLGNEIVSESSYCHHVPSEKFFQAGDMDSNKFLNPIRGMMGIYHLWSEYEHCDDHENHTMVCEYVGKGIAGVRVASHIKKKWEKGKMLFVTFHECSNRLAKYYEQLFLDTYQFELNKSENLGTETLYAVWGSERFIVGTHLNEVSSLSKMESPADW